MVLLGTAIKINFELVQNHYTARAQSKEAISLRQLPPRKYSSYPHPCIHCIVLTSHHLN